MVIINITVMMAMMMMMMTMMTTTTTTTMMMMMKTFKSRLVKFPRYRLPRSRAWQRNLLLKSPAAEDLSHLPPKSRRQAILRFPVPHIVSYQSTP